MGPFQLTKLVKGKKLGNSCQVTYVFLVRRKERSAGRGKGKAQSPKESGKNFE